jgi:hypothetical protein
MTIPQTSPKRRPEMNPKTRATIRGRTSHHPFLFAHSIRPGRTARNAVLTSQLPQKKRYP